MSDVASLLQPLLAPVVIISACGLLLLAQFARYTALVGRVRGFHKERLDLMSMVDKDPARPHLLELHRCRSLGEQAASVLDLVRLIRKALALLIATVICMVLSSLSIGLTLFAEGAGLALTVAFFVLGLLSMLGGMGYVLLEIARSLSTVSREHAELSDACEAAMERARGKAVTTAPTTPRGAAP